MVNKCAAYGCRSGYSKEAQKSMVYIIVGVRHFIFYYTRPVASLTGRRGRGMDHVNFGTPDSRMDGDLRKNLDPPVNNRSCTLNILYNYNFIQVSF